MSERTESVESASAPRRPVIDGCNPSNWDAFPEVYDHLVEGGVVAVNATTAIWEGVTETIDATAIWLKRFREHSDRLVQIRSVADIETAAATRRAGIILGWQNIASIGNDFERLEVFAALGVRIVQLAYNLRNLVANGCYEEHDDGLSTFGRRTVDKLNDLGILIDLSHVGDASSLETIRRSRTPVAITHSNLREHFDHPRNKPAELVRALVSEGGVIGANAWGNFLPRRWDSTVEDYVDSIERLIEVAGIDHVGIATDFCEGRDWDFWYYLRRLHGTIPTVDPDLPSPNPVIGGLESSAHMQVVGQLLAQRGYSEDDIAKVLSGNWIRLYGQVWSA